MDGPFTAKTLSLRPHINQVKKNAIQNREIQPWQLDVVPKWNSLSIPDSGFRLLEITDQDDIAGGPAADHNKLVAVCVPQRK